MIDEIALIKAWRGGTKRARLYCEEAYKNAMAARDWSAATDLDFLLDVLGYRAEVETANRDLAAEIERCERRYQLSMGRDPNGIIYTGD